MANNHDLWKLKRENQVWNAIDVTSVYLAILQH